MRSGIPKKVALAGLLALAAGALLLRWPQPPAAPPERPSYAPGAARTRPALATRTRPALAARTTRLLAARFADAGKWRRLGRTVLRSANLAFDELLADPMTHIQAGDRALACGQTNLAIDCFERALAIAPRHPGALRGLAIAFVSVQRHHDVLSVYERILAVSPDDETVRFNAGLAMMRVRQFGEAEEVFRKLLEGGRHRVETRFNLATVLVAQGKLAEATAQLREVVRADRPPAASDLAEAYTQLAQVLIDLGDTKGAMSAYAEAARLKPGDVAAWLNLAAAARAEGSYGYAVTATRKAAELSPFNAEIHLRLGNLLLELHRKTGRRRFLDEAVRAWRKSLKADPSRTALRRRVETYARQLSRTRPATMPAGDRTSPVTPGP